jgi:SNF2 family DNA or RNA helicase
MKFKLRGDTHSKIGWYSSIFSRGYQVSRSKYDARIRNWDIEFSDPFFIVENSDDETEYVFHNGRIFNCTCDHFVKNESGTCMHIEAVNLIPRFDALNAFKMSSKRKVDYINFPSGDIVSQSKKDSIVLPSVRLFEDWKMRSSIPEFDISSIQDWNPFHDYGVDLYDYQSLSVKRMIQSRRSVLALKMGLGKTICALTACHILSKNRIIIVCPNNLKYQWKSEIDRFNLGESLVIDKGIDLDKYESQKFLILSYEMLNRNLNFFSHDYDILIADEIQKIKNPDSVSWKSMSKIKTDFIFALSGTPIQNSINDILSIISFLNPYEFSPQWKFWEEYCDFTKAKVLGIKKSKVSDFRERIYRYMINPKVSADAIKLPKMKEFEISCTLDPDSKALHNKYLDAAMPLIAKSFNYSLTFGEKAKLNSLLTMARIASTDSRLINPDNQKSNRFSTIEKTINDIVSKGEKVVIYSEWIKSSKLLFDFLIKSNILYSIFNGDIPAKRRDMELKKFINDPNVSVFLSTDSGGLGIDGLQFAANNIIHIEKMWNPAKIKQRNGRLVRNLQKSSTVNVYYFTCNSEVEKMIESSTFRKDDLVSDILS